METVLSIRLSDGASAPNNPPPPATTPFDCVFQRSLGNDDSGRPIPPIRDVVRGLLDGTLAGSIILPDPVPGSTAEVRFLSGTGALKELVHVQVPAAGAPIRLALTAAQAGAIATL